MYQNAECLALLLLSSDTDVLLLRLAYHHHCKFKGSACTAFCNIDLGPNSKFYNVNVNTQVISLKISVKLCPFSMLLQGVILCQAFLTIARRVCGKPKISIQITAA